MTYVTPDQALRALNSLLAIAFLVWFFYGPWRKLVVDIARQNLFEMRDSLFDLAASGKIGFNDPVYIRVRYQINDMIRACEACSAFMFLIPFEKTGKKSLLDELEQIEDKALAEDIRAVIMKATEIFLISMVFRSLVMLSALIPTVMFYLSMGNSRRMSNEKTFYKKIEMIDSGGALQV